MGDIKPYEDDSEKKEQIARMFDNIAGKYDFVNRLLSLGIDKIWRRKAIHLLQKDNPAKVLDVATGTARVAIELSAELPNAKIIGVDISNKMLSIGREKIKEKKLVNRIELQFGDSEDLQFEDNEFDAVTVAFGVRNFENLAKGLEEMHRVLKPGGKMVILEFSKPVVFPLKQLFKVYFKYVLPGIGKVMSNDRRAYKYLYESVQAFPDYDRFLSVLNDLGYKKSKYIIMTGGICCIYTAEK